MAIIFKGETEISGSESYRFSGGLSLLGRAVWIISIGFLGVSLFHPLIPAIGAFSQTAGAFLTKPALWFDPLKIWPGVPAFPAIALVLFAISIILSLISIAVVCVARPIAKIALLQYRHEAIAEIVGLAGRAAYYLTDEGFAIRNYSRVGERMMRFDWTAIESNGVMRLSFKEKTVAQIPLRAFESPDEVRRFIADKASRKVVQMRETVAPAKTASAA